MLSNLHDLLTTEELKLPDLLLSNLVVLLNKLDTLESLSLTTDNDGLTRSETGGNRSNLSVDTNRKQPLASRAIDNDSAGNAGKRTGRHHLDNIASVALDSNVLALGATQSDHTLILGIDTLNLERLARNLGKDRLGPDDLALVLSAKTIHTTTASCKHNKLVEAESVAVQALLLSSGLTTKDTSDDSLRERCKVVRKVLKVIDMSCNTVDVGRERVGVSLLLKNLGEVLSTRNVSPDSSNSASQTLRSLPVNLAVTDKDPVI
jgi:hypothetical protein